MFSEAIYEYCLFVCLLHLFGCFFLNKRDNLATVVDAHHLRDLTVLGAALLDHGNDLHAREHTTEHAVFVVQMGRGHGGDKELRAVGVLARVGHGQQAGSVVSIGETLVLEVVAVDGRAASAVGFLEIAALDHEARYDAVKVGVAIAEAVQVGAESAKVLDRFGHNGAKQLNDHATNVLLFD